MWTTADSSSEWAVAVPLIAAVLTAILALAYNLVLRRRDEKRELRSLVRLLDDDLATLQSAMEALIAKSATSIESAELRAAADVVQRARSSTVWEETRLSLGRHLSFEEWDLLRDVYTVIRTLWLGADPDADDIVSEIRAVFNAENTAPRVLRVIEKARRDVCSRHLGGSVPEKVSLSTPRRPAPS